MTDNTEENDELVLQGYENDTKYLARTNTLMRARDMSDFTISQDNVFMVAMAHAVMTPTGNAQAVIYPSDCGQYKGIDKKNLSRVFSELEIASNNDTLNKTYAFKDKETGMRYIVGVIDTIVYDDKTGRFEVKFTQGFSQHFNQILSGEAFTKVSIERLTQISSMSSRKLCDILNTYEFKLKKYDRYTITYDLLELKYDLSLITNEYAYADKQLAKKLGRSPTAHEFFAAYPEAEQYKKFSEFKRNILVKAQKDFNALIEKGEHMYTFDFDYSNHRVGRGGTVVAVDITIYYPEKKEEAEPQDDVVSDMRMKEIDGELVDINLYESVKAVFQKGEKITDSSILQLIKASEGDLDKIRRVYHYSITKPCRNLGGMMVDCLRHPDRMAEDVMNDPRFESYAETVRFNEKVAHYQSVLEKQREERERREDEQIERGEEKFQMLLLEEFCLEVERDVLSKNVANRIKAYQTNYVVGIDKSDSRELLYAQKTIQMIMLGLFGFACKASTILRVFEKLNYDLRYFIEILDDVFSMCEVVDERDLASEIRRRIR